MEVNETTRPLTEVPAENTPETPVSTVENDEKTLYSPKQNARRSNRTLNRNQQ